MDLLIQSCANPSHFQAQLLLKEVWMNSCTAVYACTTLLWGCYLYFPTCHTIPLFSQFTGSWIWLNWYDMLDVIFESWETFAGTVFLSNWIGLERLPVSWRTHAQLTQICTYGDINRPHLWEESGRKGSLWDEIVSIANANVSAQRAPVHTERHWVRTEFTSLFWWVDSLLWGISVWMIELWEADASI